MPHLLSEMKSTRVPRRFVFFDTEARRTLKQGVERQRWRCGVTAEIHWASKEQHWSKPVFASHSEIGGLWATITAAARDDCRTVVVAHNLGYDLRIGDAFRMLPRLGWKIEKLVLAPYHVGFDAVNGKQRLVFVDSTNVLPGSVKNIGDLMGRKKPPLPRDDDPVEVWLHRCEADVSILMEAYLVIVDALREGDWGCWARTGSGISWNTYIRRFMNEKVLVHGNDDLRRLEHDANYGGRNEVWKWGKLPRGTWTEWDAELAYATVLAGESLPSYYRAHVVGLSMGHLRRSFPSNRYLVDASVCTTVPVLPVRDEHGTFFPVGSFRGWYWDCEVLLAEEEGATITIHQAHRYTGSRYLETWANWVIDLCADHTSPEAKIIGHAAKHWQRALVGRSSMRYRVWEEKGPAFLHGVSYMPGYDLTTGEVGAYFQVAGRRFESWERTWWDQAIPQLLSSVSAHCRVNLWKAMRIAGTDNVAYVDTDSLIVDELGSEHLAQAVAESTVSTLRVKSELTRLEVWAPRYVTSQKVSKIAGLGRDRRVIGSHRFTSSAWERLPQALMAGNLDEVVITSVTSQLTTEDWHRIHLPSGETAPYCVAGGVRTETAGLEAAG